MGGWTQNVGDRLPQRREQHLLLLNSRSQDNDVDLTTSPFGAGGGEKRTKEMKKYRSSIRCQRNNDRSDPIGTSESHRKPENSITLLVSIT